MLESQLQEASNKASSAENANTELTKMKIRLEQELNETEHALKESSEMHSKVISSDYQSTIIYSIVFIDQRVLSILLFITVSMKFR